MILEISVQPRLAIDVRAHDPSIANELPEDELAVAHGHLAEIIAPERPRRLCARTEHQGVPRCQRLVVETWPHAPGSRLEQHLTGAPHGFEARCLAHPRSGSH